MATHILDGPIDHTFGNPHIVSLLEDLQGNILKPHGRDFCRLVGLQVQSTLEAVGKARAWIGKFAKEGHVTSAKKQLEERDSFAESGGSGSVFVNFFLTSRGYKILDLLCPPDAGFIAGMKNSQLHLADPDPQEWEPGYRKDIHLLLLLAHDDEKELGRRTEAILDEVKPFAEDIVTEYGSVLRKRNEAGSRKKGEPIEHFGYVDGRSQPLFLLADIEEEKGKEPIPRRYDPSAPLSLVLVPDPNGADKEFSYGSYLVFRKLEQNVDGFTRAVQSLALQIHGTNKEERAAALVIGRFRDGTPIVDRETAAGTSPSPNNFDYSTDLLGDRCPLHAHIRQMNPRISGEDLRHRIARRGITYGERNTTLEDRPEKGVGLLFMCFQSDIRSQFEFLQRQWANDRELNRHERGIDPIIGQSEEVTKPQEWPINWGSSERIAFSFARFVTLKGGEYFFAPSISGLIKIGDRR